MGDANAGVEMTHEVYTVSRSELERLLAKMARLIAEHEEFSLERAQLWQTMFTPIVLADAGVKR